MTTSTNHRKVLLGLVAAFAMFGYPLLIALRMFLMQFPTIEEHVGPTGILPASASDVSYFDSVLGSAYEFTITEADFKQWATSCQLAVDEVRTPRRLRRFTLFRDQHRHVHVLDESSPEYSVELRSGLYFETPERHRGGCAVGFDRNTGRAYYESNSY